MLSIDQACHRVQSSEADPLGRWASTRYTGRQQKGLRVNTAYRPVRNNWESGSTYNQQAVMLLACGDTRDPLDAFDADLRSELHTWHSSGDHLVLMMDANDDIRMAESCQFPQLTEIFLHWFGNEPPPTAWGQRPIDGIWVSHGLLNSGCGHLDFHEALYSDHCALCLDIPLRTALGGTDLNHQCPSARRLKLQDPRLTERYLSAYYKAVTAANLLQRDNDLLSQVAGPLSPAQIEALEAINHERISAMLAAEHQCRKIRAGNIPWTPNFASAQHRLTYYKLSLQRIRGHPVDAHTVHWAAKRAKIRATPLSEADALERFRLACHLYKDAKAQSTTAKHTSFLEGLAAARAAAGDTDAITELRQLLTQEDQRARFCTIKALHNPDHRRGLDYVTTCLPDGSTKECTTKADIESACLAENDSRFSQSLGTPFLSQPLLDDFGLLGNSDVSAQVMNGTYTPPTGTDDHACLLLPFFRKWDHVADFTMNITHDEFIQSWHRACKRTVGGLSHLHFGHFKALLAAESPDLIDLEVAILNIVVRSGYPLLRWHVGLNVMLLKKPGVYDVTSCQTILLYEPDFNNLLKILGRRTMLNAEKFRVLAPEQFGSRKSLTSIRQALNKVLTYDLIPQRRIPVAMCSNDAKSCYDRIIHSVAKLALLRCGAPEPTVDLMFDAIPRLRHHICTAFGDSTVSYGGDPKPGDPPKHGVSQGNGTGPAIWAVLSTPALDLLHSQGTGVNLQSALSREMLRMAGYSFVDDTDLPQLSESSTKFRCCSSRNATCSRSLGRCYLRHWWHHRSCKELLVWH
jgi:hypothetical protein